MKLNCAAYYGDLYRLKRLIGAGADPSKTDYDGRSPLVLIKMFTLHLYENENLMMLQYFLIVNLLRNKIIAMVAEQLYCVNSFLH